ncbi:MAG: hypothetical protein ABT940_14495, partial [Alphaproteobacteria bacterium]
RLSGLKALSRAAKELSKIITVNRIAELAEAAAKGKLPEAEAEWLQSVGLSEAMLPQILANMKQYGTLHKGKTWFAGADLWPESDVTERFQIAVTRQVGVDVPTPGVEIPMKMKRDPLMRLATQFMSWPIAATNRLLIPALQGNTGLYALRAAPLVALGTLVAALADHENGRDPFRKGGASLLLRGVDQSGILGVYGFLPLAMYSAMSSGDLGRSVRGQGIMPAGLQAMSNLVGTAALPVKSLFDDTPGISTKEADMALSTLMFNNIYGLGYLRPRKE